MKRMGRALGLLCVLAAISLCSCSSGGAESAETGALSTSDTTEADTLETTAPTSTESTEECTRAVSTSDSTQPQESAQEIVITTPYIPIGYRQGALIVQRNEEMELYGLLDNEGNTILEPA